jgi:hypothetical protein
MTTVKQSKTDRRGVLTLLIGAPVLAAAVSLDPSLARAYDPGNDETRPRYRETDDVKAFYRTNGYES